MFLKNDSIYLHITIIFALVFSISITYWLIEERPYEQAYRLKSKLSELVEVQNHDQAEQLILDELKNGIMNPEVAQEISPYLFFFKNGYNSLVICEKLLYSLPDKENLYKKIANLFEDAPNEFTADKKKVYLQRLKDIPKINNSFLLKYNLNM